MTLPVVILHGYGGKSKGWEGMASFLGGKVDGPVSDIFLGSYESKEDDLVFGDLSEGLERELQARIDLLGGLGPRSFNLVAHSTGALVVRHWLQQYYSQRPEAIPLQNLVLLAPANFGSRLAHQGNASYGRFLNFVQEREWGSWETGRNILNGLELASPFTYDLAHGDVLRTSSFGNSARLLNADGFYTSVIIGNQPYTGRVERRIPGRGESGSDGTVRIAAASLRTRKLMIDFSRKPTGFQVTEGLSKVPLAVVPGVNHSDIKYPEQTPTASDLVFKALSVEDDASFGALSLEFDKITQATLNGTDANSHEYQQFVTRVTDDAGHGVRDYHLDFEVYDGQGDEVWKASDELNDKKLHVHTNSQDPSYRCFFVDYTALSSKIAALPLDHQVTLSLIASDISRDIRYRTDDSTRFELHGPRVAQEQIRFFAGSTTTLVDIKLDRMARSDLFEMERWKE